MADMLPYPDRMRAQIRKGDVVVVDAVRWFDRVNGNTYHAAHVTWNGNQVDVPFQYGYDRQYEESALETLVELGLLPTPRRYPNGARETLRHLLNDIGATLYSNVEDWRTKRSIVEFGSGAPFVNGRRITEGNAR